MNTEQLKIDFTPEALLKAQEIKRDFPRYQHLPLRIYIEGKGCDGFTYGVSFDEKQDNDLIFVRGDLECIIDPRSYQFCKGSLILWVDDERGTGFLVQNPNQTKYRGKFYKKRIWQDILNSFQS